MIDGQTLAGSGFIANLSVLYWRGACNALRREAINATGQLSSVFLLPPTLRKKCESVRHLLVTNVTDWSYMTRWGRFMPHQAYPTWRIKHNELTKRFFGLRDEVVLAYDQVVAFNQEQAKGVARLLWQNKMKYPGTPNPRFEAQIWSELMTALPTKKELYDSFQIHFDAAPIPLVTFDRLRLPTLMAEMAANQARDEEEFLCLIRSLFYKRVRESCLPVVNAYVRRKRLPLQVIQRLYVKMQALKLLNILEIEEFNQKFEELDRVFDECESKGEWYNDVIHSWVLELMAASRFSDQQKLNN